MGAPCNGCGVCCLLEPCPLGVALTLRRQGACRLLRWQASEARYRCGVIADAQDVLQQRLPSFAQGLSRSLEPALRRLAWRWVAAGTGCDCDAHLEEPSTAVAMRDVRR